MHVAYLYMMSNGLWIVPPFFLLISSASFFSFSSSSFNSFSSFFVPFYYYWYSPLLLSSSLNDVLSPILRCSFNFLRFTEDRKRGSCQWLRIMHLWKKIKFSASCSSISHILLFFFLLLSRSPASILKLVCGSSITFYLSIGKRTPKRDVSHFRGIEFPKWMFFSFLPAIPLSQSLFVILNKHSRLRM